MKKAELKDWFIQEIQGKYRLCGKVYGHPDFKDGTVVTTSSIQEAITRNTHYILKPENKLFKE